MSNKPNDTCFEIWHIVVASLLLSIWLGMNENNFSNSKMCMEAFSMVFTLRTFKWLELVAYRSDNGYNLWLVNPSGAHRLHSKDKENVFWTNFHSGYDLICVTYGSLFLKGPDDASAGIGGWIRDKSGNTLFTL